MSKELATAGVGLILTGDETRQDENPAAVYLAGLSSGSRRTMAQALGTIADMIAGVEGTNYLSIPWKDMRFQHTVAIRSELVDRYNFATANKMLSALRGTLKASWKLGQMSAEDYYRAVSVENVKGESVQKGRHISAGELGALLDTCSQDSNGIRDAAIISVWYATGMRRAEIVALNTDDYEVGDELGKFLISGKRNKQRELWIDNGAMFALRDWLRVRGEEPGALFLGTGNRNRGNRLTTQALYYMLRSRAKKAGIEKELTPHDFRRTFAGELLDRGADIVTVQKMMGHANVTTTARYDRRDDRAKQAAAKLIHVPYKRRTLKTETRS
jgi:site-specific recombinase XerD